MITRFLAQPMKYCSRLLFSEASSSHELKIHAETTRGVSSQQPSSETRLRQFLLARTLRLKVAWLILTILLALHVSALYHAFCLDAPAIHRDHSLSKPDIAKVQQCTVDNLQKNTYFLDIVLPIRADEFIQRRDSLATALVEAHVSAFVLEPGYTFQYYGNISQTDWEPWEPEERPFLMIVQPDVSALNGAITARISFLAPHFEEGRVRMLGIPSSEDLNIVTWEEHWDPYNTLRKDLFNDEAGVTLMIDEELRDYIVRGLNSAGFQTIGLNPVVEAVRQQKTPSEVSILRAVNTGTVEAVRQMRPCLVPGLTENEVAAILNNALLSLGFRLFFNIVLFEENAALPHGGFITGDKVLTHDTMVLIDVGAHYMGYSSDICRSFLIDPPPYHPQPKLLSKLISYLPVPKVLRPQHPRPYEPANQTLHDLKLSIHNLVLAAQSATIPYFTPNSTAAQVDLAARDVISSAGYGPQFTHRVGHGIGIKAHESPYLHKGNTQTELLKGMVFTSEPGVYLEGIFGVRTEDVFLVRSGDDGEGGAECLSGRRAKGPYDP